MPAPSTSDDFVELVRKSGVVDEKLSHTSGLVCTIECEHQTTGPTLVGKIQAVIVAAGSKPVQEIDALRSRLIAPEVAAAGMVVNHVEDNGQVVGVANFDQRLQLADLCRQV